MRKIRASRSIDKGAPRGARAQAEALFAALTQPPAPQEKVEKVVLRGQLPNGTPYPLVYRWSRNGRHGQACRILTREKKDCLVEFADGFQMMTSRTSLKKGQTP